MDGPSRPPLVRTMTRRQARGAAPCKPGGAVCFGHCERNAKWGSDRIVPISQKNEVSPGIRYAILETAMGITLAAYLFPTEAEAGRYADSPGKPRDDCPLSRNLAAMDPQSRPPVFGACHLIVMLVFLEGARLGPLRFPALSLFAQRLRFYKVKRFSPSSEIPAVHDRAFNGAMLVDCEIYHSFAGGKVAVQR